MESQVQVSDHKALVVGRTDRKDHKDLQPGQTEERYRLSKKKGYKLKTLNEGLPLEDSSDFDDFYTE